MANEKPSTQTQPHGDAATRKKTETSVAEAGSSAEKKVTPKNALLGLQHVLVSNVWLDPVFVAGAIGLPLALSSNMVNAIFIVSGLVTLIQATKLVRLPIVQGPSAAFDALMIAAGTAGSLAAAGTSIFISSLIFLVLCLTRVIEKLRFLFAPIVSGVIIFLVGVSLSGFTLSEFLGGAPGDKGFADPKTLAVSIITCVLVVVLSQFGKGMVKALSYLIALVVGTALSLAFGMADFSAVASSRGSACPSSCRMAVSISTRRFSYRSSSPIWWPSWKPSACIRRPRRSKARSSRTARCVTVLPERPPVRRSPR